MSALTDLRARITGPDGHLLDRGTIAAELERAIGAEEHAPAGALLVDRNAIEKVLNALYPHGNENQKTALSVFWMDITKLKMYPVPAEPEREVSAMDLGRTFRQLTAKKEARP